MQQMPASTVSSSRAPAIADVKPKPQLDIWNGEKATNPQQFISFSSYKAPAPSEECNLELTLATGPSTSSSCNAERPQGKRLKSSSNSDSGTTAVSSTSTDSAARCPGESRRMDQMGQGPWMYQCLTLKTA
jgi:hypothetical protein